MSISSRLVLIALFAAGISTALAQPPPPAPLVIVPNRSSATYSIGDAVVWTLHERVPGSPPSGEFSYTIKENALNVIASGAVSVQSGPAMIQAKLDHPGMLYLEVTPNEGGQVSVAGAAIDPRDLKPVVPCPADFDVFWAEKIRMLEAIPPNPVVTPEASGQAGVWYASVRMDNIRKSHIYGQMAKPDRPGKFPAVLVLQWAGVYGLQKSWVVDRAARGWLALNIEAHDLPGDLPANFYQALPAMIQAYNSIYDDDRDRCYFLRMYLGAYRAVEYLARRPEWDGRILLATGTSMGGQQSLAVAGLNPRITHVIVDVPAGADSNAALHGRLEPYPFWNVSSPQVAATGLYFDTVNLAARIHAKTLLGLGYVDTTCAPSGTWTAFNQIPAPKEVVPMIDSPHNNFATPAQQQPFWDREAAWLAALVKDAEPDLRTAN